MEHPKPHNLAHIVILLMAICLFSSCKSKEPNPENLDPIYSDLQKKAKDAETVVRDQEKKIEDLDAILNKPEIRIGMHKRTLREKYLAQDQLVQMKQKQEYFDIRVEQRKAFDQRDYEAAFRKNEPWPRPEDKAEYDLVNKMNSISLNWNDHVPKSTRYLKPGAAGATKEKAKPAEKAEKKEE